MRLQETVQQLRQSFGHGGTLPSRCVPIYLSRRGRCMDDENAGGAGQPFSELESRLPTEDDLVLLCRRLNELGARYLVIGGFAIIQSGLPRSTGDIDLLVAADLENEALVYRALEVFPDKASRQLQPGEVGKYGVVRVADEVIVDLMRAACGIEYAEASQQVVVREVQGVLIPFASARLLWRTKIELIARKTPVIWCSSANTLRRTTKILRRGDPGRSLSLLSFLRPSIFQRDRPIED